MRHWLALFVVGGALVTVALAAPPLSLSDDQRRRLDAGEVILLDVLPPTASTVAQGGTAIAIVRASPETVWGVLRDFRSHSGLYPRVVTVDLLEADAQRALVRYVFEIGPFSFDVHMDKFPDTARRRMEWRLADRHPNRIFRESSGYWQVEAAPGGSMVTYAIAVRTILPGFITRRAERDSLVDTVTSLRERVGHQASRSHP